jgi:hypothetical protein
MAWRSHRPQRIGDACRDRRAHHAPVLTPRAAATLLARADSLESLLPLARALGFTRHAEPLPAALRRELGVHDLVDDARIAAADGALRLVAAQLATPHAPTVDAREATRRLATALLRHAPATYWCVTTLDHTRRALCIATVTPHPHGPRIAALRIDRDQVVDSDADTLRALAAAATLPDASLRHARFTDILRRDALSARFYRALEGAVTRLGATAAGSASPTDRATLALLCTSRLLFLAFLEAKGWLDHDRQFLLAHTTRRLQDGGHLHQRLLRPLFFGTLNTPVTRRAPAARAFGRVPFLNGGLFAPTPLEKRHASLRFHDDAIVALVGDLLDRYRFTAREDSTRWSEAAVDPEMLGRAFESLMHRDERRRSGAFYTPPALVDQAVRDALATALPGLPPEALDGDDLGALPPIPLDPATRSALDALRVLDPACGSGAFLVHALERLAALRVRIGDQRPVHAIRRDLLTRSIFGVDRNPIAVWLCELRLWLSVVIECPEQRPARIAPLPNLDHNIRVGDALAGGDLRFAAPEGRSLARLRERYGRATGPRKRTLARTLDQEERRRAIDESTRRIGAIDATRRELLATLRTRDLFGERRRPSRADDARLAQLRIRQRELTRQHTRLALGDALPFRFASHFADMAATGGFPVVIGNPPWVRPHALPMAERQRLKLEYRTVRDAAWRAGAARAGAATGFAAQADLSAAFIERSVSLLAPGGTLALLVPAKLWRALAGGGVRRLLHEQTDIHQLHDWSDAPALFEAATYPSLIVARRHAAASSAAVGGAATTGDGTGRRDDGDHGPSVSVHVARRRTTERFPVPRRSLPLTDDPAAPWLLLPPDARRAFDRLRAAGPALGDSPLGRPTLGVKCGCNAAFLVHAIEHDGPHDEELATVTADTRRGLVERHLLRPALRGDAIDEHMGHPRRAPSRRAGARHANAARGPGDLRIIWTHGADGAPLRTLPPRTARWLAHWRPRLEARRDARSRQPWWTLFRTDAAHRETPRLVWADIGRRLRSTVLHAGDPTVPLNSCYVLRTPSLDDAFALHALLTSPLAGAWLDAIAEPARGGFRRFLGWTVAALPVPTPWDGVRHTLATLGRRLATDHAPTPDEHLAVTADAYGVPVRSLAPLLDWMES